MLSTALAQEHLVVFDQDFRRNQRQAFLAERGGLPREQVGEQRNRVGDVELIVVIDVTGLHAAERLAAAEEVVQRLDGIGDVELAVTVRIAQEDRNTGGWHGHGDRVGLALLAAAVPALVFTRLLTWLPLAPGEAVVESRPWLPDLGVELGFRVDGLSMIFALLVTGIGALVLVYAAGYTMLTMANATRATIVAIVNVLST